MRKFSFALVCLFAISVVFNSCQKESTMQAPEKKAPAAKAVNEPGPDNQCTLPSGGIGTDAALRQIVFLDPPYSVFYNFTLANPADVEIYAQDCCIQDDVVELYVDGCLVATIDSRGSATPYSETHTVTLLAGDHEVEYRNTISGVSASGWNVSETFLPVSNIVIDGCDSGVPNVDVTCGNSMTELIMACAVGAVNHGDFVSCAAHLTNTWKKAGLITGAQKDAIMSCVGSSNIP